MKALEKNPVFRSAECFREAVRYHLVRWLVFEFHHAFFNLLAQKVELYVDVFRS